MEPPEGCPAEMVRVMSDAWALNPADRPTFGQVDLYFKDRIIFHQCCTFI